MPRTTKTTTAKLNRKATTKEKVDTAKSNAKKATRKSKKDSSEPKRGLTAYMFFSKEFREKVRQENPKASFGKFNCGL
jgi:hypothetical protein